MCPLLIIGAFVAGVIFSIPTIAFAKKLWNKIKKTTDSEG